MNQDTLNDALIADLAYAKITVNIARRQIKILLATVLVLAAVTVASFAASIHFICDMNEQVIKFEMLHEIKAGGTGLLTPVYIGAKR